MQTLKPLLHIPADSGHRFRTKAATHSGRRRPLIPDDSGHPLKGNLAADSGAG